MKMKKRWLLATMLAHVCASAGLAADPTITVQARQRYPWNGLVDINFTITGTSGTKYDTSFTAKDMVGNTNIAMRTIRKADGTAAAAQEQLLPGTYSWVWDAAADLNVDTITHEGFLTTSSTILFVNQSLAAMTDFSAVFGGNAISHADGEPIVGNAYNIKADGQGKSMQFQISNGSYLKCVCVHLEQAGNDIVGYIKWARYMANTFPLGTDFDTASYTAYSVATSNSEGGYGIASLTLTCPNPRVGWQCDRVTVTGTAVEHKYLYMVIDLSGGANASSYPVSYLDAVPSGGWSDTYKTTKLVLRRIEPGSFKMQGTYNVTLTKPFFCGVFEVTQKQYALVMETNPSESKGNKRPVDMISYNMIRGSSNGSKWPSSSAVDSSSFMGKFRARTGLNFDLPTEAQWEYACRAGTTSTYNNGGNSENDLKKLGRYSGNRSDGKGGYSQHTTVGSYLPNAWGIYDMHGNVDEWCLDFHNNLSNNVTDPKGAAIASYSNSRVVRSGGFTSGASTCSSTGYRNPITPEYKDWTQGFRIFLTLSN